MRQDQQHHSLEEQCSQVTAIPRTSTSSVSVSRVAFALAAVASLSLLSSFAMAVRASSSFPSTLSAELLAALCSFVTTKKALFVLSNIIFLFLAADCRCFFCVCSISPSTGDAADYENPNGSVLAKQAQHHQHEMVEGCAVQPLVCSCSGSHDHSRNEQGKREDVLASSQPQSFGVEVEEEENSVTLETVVVEEPTCGAAQELEKLQIDELNRKFEEFIRSRRIKWQQEEALQCQ